MQKFILFPVFALLAIAVLASGGRAESFPRSLLYTVTNANVLATIDVDQGCSTTMIGVTADAVSPFTVRRIRGLAYDGVHDVMYGMTREGDLVTVDRLTGATTHVLQLPCGSTGGEFWSGLAFDGADKLYATNAFEDIQLAEITLGGTPSAACIGSTAVAGSTLQILGTAMYTGSAFPIPATFNGSHPNSSNVYGVCRNTANIFLVDQSTGSPTLSFGGNTSNPQFIAFHPTTGRLNVLHDKGLLETFDFSTATFSQLCQLPFWIDEQGPCCGNDTYGWGGLAFAPAPGPSAAIAPGNHYMCYSARIATGQPRFVPAVRSLKDQFGGPANFGVSRIATICNPADKNGEGIVDAAVHEVGYKIKAYAGFPRFVPSIHTTTDQFAQRSLDVRAPASLLDVTPKQLGSIPPPPFPSDPTADPAINRFKCYTAKLPMGTPPLAPLTVKVADEFFPGGQSFVLTKVTKLCAPVDKQNETPGAELRSGHLVCYQARLPARTRFARRTVAVNDSNFSPTVLEALRPDELCVPACKDTLAPCTS